MRSKNTATGWLFGPSEGCNKTKMTPCLTKGGNSNDIAYGSFIRVSADGSCGTRSIFLITDAADRCGSGACMFRSYLMKECA